jgi:hypothetical protein
MLRATPAYTPPGRLTHVVLALLGLNAALAWLVIVGMYTLLDRIWNGMAGRLAAADTLEAHMSQLNALRLIQGLAWLATAAVFLWWLYRAHRNLPALGAADLGFTPRSAVSAFFVPVLNVVVPVRVMREVWNRSDPTVGKPRSGCLMKTSPWVAWWWGVFVCSILLDPVVFRIAGDLQARLTVGTTVLLVLGQLLEMSAAVLAMVIVWSVNQGQQEIFDHDDAE